MSKAVLMVFLASVLFLLVGVGRWLFISQLAARDANDPWRHSRFDHQRLTLVVGDRSLNVEVVNQPASMEQGLSGRSAIGADGMVFVLPRLSQPAFWMKDMLLDLDLVWIAAGKVAEVTPNVPRPQANQPERTLPLYQPTTEIDMVLEVPAGQAAAWGLVPGQTVQLKK
jgi:uncharacterized membrane protein (UPF0127 family)